MLAFVSLVAVGLPLMLAMAGLLVAAGTLLLANHLAPKEMGVILAAAVAVDAALVRPAFLPVLLRLAGHKIRHRLEWLGLLLPDISFNHCRHTKMHGGSEGSILAGSCLATTTLPEFRSETLCSFPAKPSVPACASLFLVS